MDPSQPQDTRKKLFHSKRKFFFDRWVVVGDKRKSISKINKFFEVAKSSANNVGFEKSSDNNDGLQSLPSASTPCQHLDLQKSKTTKKLLLFDRWVSKEMPKPKIYRKNIKDFQTEVEKSSDNNDGFEKSSDNNDGLQSLPSSSTMTSCPSKIKSEMSTPCTSNTKRHMSTPCTPIPYEFKWIRVSSTPQERRNFLEWASAEARKTEDPDERKRLIDWADFVNTPFIAFDDPPQVTNLYLTEWTLPTSKNTATNQHKRLRAHSTSRTPAPDEPKRWSLQEEVTKPFEIAMIRLQRERKQKVLKIQEHRIYTYKGEPGLYECQNALWVWAELIDYPKSSKSVDEGPKYVGEQIKEKFPEEAYDMIEGRPSINELGFVTIKLSGKWIAKSIHNMLKDGLDTWAPKLPVERVIVAHPSLGEEMAMDLIGMLPIRYTLMSILDYSKVDATIGRPMDGLKSSEPDGVWASELLNKWFPWEERNGEVVTKGRVPFILPKRDSENAYKDIFALWHGLHKHKADWIVYLTPVRKQVYIEMCLSAAKLEGWIPIDRHKPPRTRYAGYQTCRFRLGSTLFAKHCLEVSKGEAAKLLGYSVEAVSDCVLRYTSLMNHRLAVCRFGAWMFSKKQNTFIYLLNTRAQIHRLTNHYRKDIDELKKASKLILEKDKGWETGEERVLGFHLLEFTEALEESCLSVMPHILCGYLYDLCKKFNCYHSSLRKDGFVGETSTLLLYEATAVVIEKCFHLLGILPKSSLFGLSMAQLLSGLLCPTNVERPIGVKASDPTRNFRFEMVSFYTVPQTPLWLDEEGELFGLISVSSRSHFFEAYVTHIPLFNHDWRNRIKHPDRGFVFLGNPSSGCSVSFSYFIEIYADLYVTNKNECYQLCDQKKEIDLSSLWDTNSDGVCGQLPIFAEHGLTRMYYYLLKDAIDTALKVEFKTKLDAPARLVRGYIQAYYGDEFLYKCQSGPIPKRCYMALLFKAAPYELTAGFIELIKSFMAVPTKGALVVKAYLQDVNSKKVIINGTCNFEPLLRGYSRDTITSSEDCSLNICVSWDFQHRYI